MSAQERFRQRLRASPAWEVLVLGKALVQGGQRRQTAVAQILRPDNLFQPHATTASNRYPEEFAAVHAALDVTDPAILSFGCSSGEELLSLRHSFPMSRVHGIDINPLAVRTARKRVAAAGQQGAVTVARGRDASAVAAASYDVVLALAVFRHADLNDGPPTCDAVLRFADFERTIDGLAAAVKPGGLLVIRHANFRFTDCAVAAGFEAAASGYGSVGEGGLPTPVYGRDNALLGFELRDDGVYRRVR